MDPCDNFYTFACGSWLNRTAVPDEKDSYGTFTALRDQVHVDLKGKIDRESPTSPTRFLSPTQCESDNCFLSFLFFFSFWTEASFFRLAYLNSFSNGAPLGIGSLYGRTSGVSD